MVFPCASVLVLGSFGAFSLLFSRVECSGLVCFCVVKSVSG